MLSCCLTTWVHICGRYYYQCGSERHPFAPHWDWESSPKALFEATLKWVGADTPLAVCTAHDAIACNTL